MLVMIISARSKSLDFVVEASHGLDGKLPFQIAVFRERAEARAILTENGVRDLEQTSAGSQFEEPWLRDPQYGGMSAESARLSWEAKEARRTVATAATLSPSLARRFTPVAIDDVSLTTEPAWLIQGLLPAIGLACVVGAPKSGKSFFATDMLFTVARGVSYAGRQVSQGPVFYLTGEGVAGYKRRLVAMRQHYQVEGNGTPFHVIENVPDLGSEQTDLPQLLADLHQYIAASCLERPKAVVLDTLARCMGSR